VRETPEVSQMFYDEKTVDLYVKDVVNNPKDIMASAWVTPAIEQSKLLDIVNKGIAFAKEIGDRKNG